MEVSTAVNAANTGDSESVMTNVPRNAYFVRSSLGGGEGVLDCCFCPSFVTIGYTSVQRQDGGYRVLTPSARRHTFSGVSGVGKSGSVVHAAVLGCCQRAQSTLVIMVSSISGFNFNLPCGWSIFSGSSETVCRVVRARNSPDLHEKCHGEGVSDKAHRQKNKEKSDQNRKHLNSSAR